MKKLTLLAALLVLAVRPASACTYPEACGGTASGSTDSSGTTATTFNINSDAVGTEPANGSGLTIEGGSGDASFLWDATNNDLVATLPGFAASLWPANEALLIPNLQFPIDPVGGTNNPPGIIWPAANANPPAGSGAGSLYPIWMGVSRADFSGTIDNVWGITFNADIRNGGFYNSAEPIVKFTLENSYLENALTTPNYQPEVNYSILRNNDTSDQVNPIFWRTAMNEDGLGRLINSWGGFELFEQEPTVTGCSAGSTCKETDTQIGNGGVVVNLTSTGTATGANLTVYDDTKYMVWHRTATGGTTTTLVDSGANFPFILNTSASLYTIVIVAGNCSGQSRVVAARTNATTLTTSAWGTGAILPTCTGGAPDNTSVYELWHTPRVAAVDIENAPLVGTTTSQRGLYVSNKLTGNDTGGSFTPGGPKTGELVGASINNIFEGNAANRGIGLNESTGNADNAMVGLDISNTFTATGTNNDFGDAVGIRVQPLTQSATPGGNSTKDVYGVLVSAPAITSGTANSTNAFFAGDMKGIGNSAVLKAAAQTASANQGRKGNVWMVGGAWDTGHFQLNTTHLYNDANGFLRVTKGGEPTAATTGNPIVKGSQSTVFGPAIWGILDADGACDGTIAAPDATPTCGDEVCALAGLACQDVLAFGANGTHATTADPGACTNFSLGAGVYIVAMCK